MSSELESIIMSIVANNYVSLIIMTAVGYDYILTLSDEVEYIWSKQWTKISTLFVIVRYSGLGAVMIYSIFGSSFLPGPAEVIPYIIDEVCPYLRALDVRNVVFVSGEWIIFPFVTAADLAMILRVWALYARSKIILGILLALYVLQIIPLVITRVLTTIGVAAPTAKPVTVVRVLDFAFCVPHHNSNMWPTVYSAIQFVLAATMCSFVASKFVRNSLQMYRMTKKWQPSRYINLFAKEGTLYFFAILLLVLLNIIFQFNIPLTGWEVIPVGILQYVPVFTLTPRFIMSVRAMYTRDLRGRYGSHTADTGFGLESGHGSVPGEGTMVFADVPGGREDDGLELYEEPRSS